MWIRSARGAYDRARSGGLPVFLCHRASQFDECCLGVSVAMPRLELFRPDEAPYVSSWWATGVPWDAAEAKEIDRDPGYGQWEERVLAACLLAAICGEERHDAV